MSQGSQWIIRGPIDLRSAIIDLGRSMPSKAISIDRAPHIEAAALAMGWRYGYDWWPVLKWAIDGEQGNPPRPRGRPRGTKPADALPD